MASVNYSEEGKYLLTWTAVQNNTIFSGKGSSCMVCVFAQERFSDAGRPTITLLLNFRFLSPPPPQPTHSLLFSSCDLSPTLSWLNLLPWATLAYIFMCYSHRVSSSPLPSMVISFCHSWNTPPPIFFAFTCQLQLPSHLQMRVISPPHHNF